MAQAGRVRLSAEDVARAAYQVGFRGDALTIAVAVAHAESTLMRDVISVTNDYGLWQINYAAHHTQYDFPRLLTDPVYNAQAAWDISGKGKNWSPWSAYNNGNYRQYLNVAVAAVRAVMGTTSDLPTNPVSNPVNPADVTAQTPSSPAYNQPVVRIDPNEYQAEFDNRHRRVGTRSRLMDIFAGPTYTGVIYPVLPNNNQGKTPSFGSQSGVRGETSAGIPGWTQGLKFEFNPNEISFDYSANPNVLPMGALDPSQTNTNLPMPDSNTVISFDLLFDRTYEVMEGSNLGVLTDVRALERIAGITEAEPVMRQNPVAIHLGSPVQFHFKAILSSFAVRYQHFSHAMVPMRAAVSITARRLSNVDPWATEEMVRSYTGDDWRATLVEVNQTGITGGLLGVKLGPNPWPVP
jgi:hypothetical protein